uniref:Uncharacterized protein n=1 Tax=Anopheles minimus TaxID=112268 RepID=A0A182WNL8_9DIPT
VCVARHSDFPLTRHNRNGTGKKSVLSVVSRFRQFSVLLFLVGSAFPVFVNGFRLSPPSSRTTRHSLYHARYPVVVRGPCVLVRKPFPTL